MSVTEYTTKIYTGLYNYNKHLIIYLFHWYSIAEHKNHIYYRKSSNENTSSIKILVKYLTTIFGRDVSHVVSTSLMNSQSSSGCSACHSHNRLKKKIKDIAAPRVGNFTYTVARNTANIRNILGD